MKDGINPFVGSEGQEEKKAWKVFRTYKGTYFWNAQSEPDTDYKEKCHGQSIGTEKWPLQHAGCKWRARLHLSKLKKSHVGDIKIGTDENQRERFSCTVGQEGPHHIDAGRLQPFLPFNLTPLSRCENIWKWCGKIICGLHTDRQCCISSDDDRGKVYEVGHSVCLFLAQR